MIWNRWNRKFLKPVAATLLLLTLAQTESSPAVSHPERGMWVWRFESWSLPPERERLLAFCSQEKIDRLLVQVHYKLNPQTNVPESVLAPEELGDLIQKANAAGISVEALEGDPEWSHRSGQATFWPKLEAILIWNEQQPRNRRFTGLHLDVEPYLLKEFKSDRKPELMREYLGFLEQVRQRMRQQVPEWTLAADIPFWYDSNPETDLEHCVVEFNGKKKYLNCHVQDICDYVGVLTYRQKALGENAIVPLCEGELSYAEQLGKKIFACVEMSPAKGEDPPTISFYGTPLSWFRSQLDLVYKTLENRPGFAGVLIHHYQTYRDFLESSPEEH